MSPALQDYLPGCYHNLSCLPGESLPGFLLRLAEANGYPGVRALLRAAGITCAGPLRPLLLRLYTDSEQLARLSCMAAGDPGPLASHFAEPLPPPSHGPAEALFRQERRVDLDALLPTRSPVCSQCLAEREYVREEWDLAPVTVCTDHAVLLIDECPRCERALTWDRPLLAQCGDCGQDLRPWPATPAGDAVCRVVADFQALAPFRFTDDQERVYIADWDETFKAFKALLLPDNMWATDTFPPSHVASTSLKARHALVERLAEAHRGNQYRLSALRWRAQKALAPLGGLPIPHALETVATRFLEVTVGLSRELATALSRTEDPPEVPSAAEVFSGLPPQLRTPEAVQEFLQISADDVSQLYRLGVIARVSQEWIGHDADHVMNARRFLASLLGLPELNAIVGVAVSNADLDSSSLLPRWNGTVRSDARVMPQRLIELQLDLTAAWHRSESPTHGQSLRALASLAHRPFDLVTAVVKDIIMGSIKKFSWQPPYAWTDLEIDVTESSVVSRFIQIEHCDARLRPPSTLPATTHPLDPDLAGGDRENG